MNDDFFSNLLSEIRKINNQKAIKRKKICTLYLDADNFEKLKSIAKDGGMSVSEFIDSLISISLAALRNNVVEENIKSESEPAPKCWVFSCERRAEKIIVHKPTGKKYAVCIQHMKDFVESSDAWEVLT
ncbi:MAG: hypothetical protein QXN34_06960 [Archaeoglobaceae archaeon]